MERTELLKLKEEIEADLAAVNRLMSRPEREKKVNAVMEATSPRRPIGQIAEEIIKNIGKEFTVSDIVIEVGSKLGKTHYQRYSPVVSAVINKLRQRNPPEIRVEEEGRGSRSGTYRYIKPE